LLFSCQDSLYPSLLRLFSFNIDHLLNYFKRLRIGGAILSDQSDDPCGFRSSLVQSVLTDMPIKRLELGQPNLNKMTKGEMELWKRMRVLR
jgi:hypothetical protein